MTTFAVSVVAAVAVFAAIAAASIGILIAKFSNPPGAW